MKIKFRILLFIIAVMPRVLLADVSVNTLFSDHMVIHHKTVIPVWGWTDTNEKVEVIGGWGKSAKTITDVQGNWRVNLQTPKTNGPFAITVTGKNKIIINDVLSGEVWLCTGQSNMDFAMSRFYSDPRERQYQPLVDYIRNEVAIVNDHGIRHIEV